MAAGAFNTANGANGLAQGAYNTANTNATNITSVNGFAVSAYNQANSSTLLAQSAYDTANLKFNTSGGNINGSVTITANNNLTVTGNLYVLGNTTSFGTQTLEVVDPMILLATGNYTADLLDIGFSGSYNDGANAHTGLFRDAAGNKDWYFFEGYTQEVSGNNNVIISDPSFRTSNVNVNYLKGNLIATTAVVNGVNIRDVQNTQNTNITAVNNYAASAYAQANTNATNISITNGVDATQNTRLNSIETINTNQNTSISIIQGVDLTQNTNITAVNNFAAGAYAQANTANTRAFNSVLKSGDTMTGTLIVPAINVGATNIVGVSSNTFTTVSTSQVSIDTFSASVYRSAKYQVQITSGINYHVIELYVVHDGTTTYLAQYGEIFTNSSLGTFDTDISGGNVRLLFTGVNSVSTINIFKTTLVV